MGAAQRQELVIPALAIPVEKPRKKHCTVMTSTVVTPPIPHISSRQSASREEGSEI